MKTMKTIEDIYKEMFEEHDENINAANPWGCNQYGHRKGHKGGNSQSQPKKEESKESKESETSENDDNSGFEKSHDYKDWRKDIEEVVYKVFSRLARNGYVDGIYFDGEKFHTDSQDGRATLLYTADDIDDFLEENSMTEARVDDQTERFMQTRAHDVFDEIDWEEVEENKKYFDHT